MPPRDSGLLSFGVSSVIRVYFISPFLGLLGGWLDIWDTQADSHRQQKALRGSSRHFWLSRVSGSPDRPSWSPTPALRRALPWAGVLLPPLEEPEPLASP